MNKLVRLYLLLLAISTLGMALPGCDPHGHGNPNTNSRDDPANDSPPPVSASPPAPVDQNNNPANNGSNEVSRDEALAKCRSLQSPDREECEQRVNDGFRRSAADPT